MQSVKVPPRSMIEHGAVHVDRSRVWVDAWALEVLRERVQRSHASASSAELETLSLRLRSLYAGSFCPLDDSPSIARATARLRRVFVTCVEELVTGMQRTGQLESATGRVESALDRGETDETLHRLAITLCLQRGLFSEAERAYERCATTLRLRCRARPSAQTERLLEVTRSRGEALTPSFPRQVLPAAQDDAGET